MNADCQRQRRPEGRKQIILVFWVFVSNKATGCPVHSPCSPPTTTRISMATLLPPPKRQKLDNSHPRSVQSKVGTTEERYVPQVIVQFKNAEDGALLGPAINLPADTNREALQMLVNKLRGEVSSTCDTQSPPSCTDCAVPHRMRIRCHTLSTSFQESRSL